MPSCNEHKFWDVVPSNAPKPTRKAPKQHDNRELDTGDTAIDMAPLEMYTSRPINFGNVIPGVFRSSYPQPQDYPFLKSLKLKTIITLVDKELPEGFQDFMDENSINHRVFGMAGTKKAAIPVAMMGDIMSHLIDRANYPLLVHCNQGKHRTGCVVGVLRKYHGWNVDSVITEYREYASDKVRDTDVEYLISFKLASLQQMVARFRHNESNPESNRHFSSMTLTVLAVLLFVFFAYRKIWVMQETTSLSY